ncbi:MAG TPA: twin-arginine translocase TatA/TatE family subunit [Patescibacteria group bacterium]
MFGLGRFEELLIILAIILVLFGGTKLPQLSKGLSDSIRELRKAFKDDSAEDTKKITKVKTKEKTS